jgi:hypothetical protein
MTQETHPRLRAAYAIIDGIPETRIDLDTWRRDSGKITCGTIACAAGWLALHPDMQAMGLSALLNGGPAYQGLEGFGALAQFFGIDTATAGHLFSYMGSYYDPPTCRGSFPWSDKAIWLARVRNFLETSS